MKIHSFAITFNDIFLPQPFETLIKIHINNHELTLGHTLGEIMWQVTGTNIATLILQNNIGLGIAVLHLQKINGNTIFKVDLRGLIVKRTTKTGALVIGRPFKVYPIGKLLNNLGFSGAGHAGNNSKMVFGTVVD